MKLEHCATLAAAALLAVGLSGCGNNESKDNAAQPTSATTVTPTTTAVATPAPNLIGPSPAPLPPPSPTHPPAPAPEPLADVDCGQITAPNGATANVIAFAGPAGRAGCTDAITVASDYVGIPRTGDAAAVDGWTCQPQPDATIPHVCFNNGLTVGLRGAAAPAAPPPPAPTPVVTQVPNRTPQPVNTTEPPAPAPADTVEDVNCGPVTDADGATRHVIAVGSADGRVGCTEAIDVATQYVRTVAPSDVVTVEGWSCEAQPDATTPAICTKGGLIIGLRAS